jgi:AAA15 family ATPase/GTPase
MFKEFVIKNFRTHTDTKLPIKDIALVIGSNNSGKSNLLAAIQHFSGLIKRANPDENNPQENRMLKKNDLFPHRHRLHTDKPMEFFCTWENKYGNIQYHIKIFNNRDKILCVETIDIVEQKGSTKKIVTTESEQINLRTQIEHENIDENKKRLARDFFRDLASIYYFNFQPALLKGDIKYQGENLKPDTLRIASQLGKEGGNLQNIIKIIYEHEKGVYDKFVLLLRKFVDSFYGISIKDGNVYWQFDLNRVPPKPEEFPAHVVSDGLLKAAAIALLASMDNPPSLIMLEEVENGINQKNIQHLFNWLSKITGRGYTTQVIATTHSPSILREFADNLDRVFYVALLPKGFKSVVSDLNALLINDMKAGRIDGDIVEIDGKELVKVEPLELIKLFYMGIIGGI